MVYFKMVNNALFPISVLVESIRLTEQFDWKKSNARWTSNNFLTVQRAPKIKQLNH